MFVTGLIVVVVAIVAFFAIANRKTAADHRRFTAKDVELALAEVISPDSRDHDAWDLFLSWPIDDAYLESIRQRCLAIVNEDRSPPPGKDISPEAESKVQALLNELRESSRAR